MPILKSIDHARSAQPQDGYSNGDDAGVKHRTSHNPLRSAANGAGAVAGGVAGGVGAVAGGVGSMTQAVGAAVLGRDEAKGAHVYVCRVVDERTKLTGRALTQMLRQRRKLLLRDRQEVL
jgi:hypothetical protein